MDLVEKFDAKGKTGAPYHVEVYQTQQDEADEAARAFSQRSDGSRSMGAMDAS